MLNSTRSTADARPSLRSTTSTPCSQRTALNSKLAVCAQASSTASCRESGVELCIRSAAAAGATASGLLAGSASGRESLSGPGSAWFTFTLVSRKSCGDLTTRPAAAPGLGLKLIWRDVCQGGTWSFHVFCAGWGRLCGRLGGWRSGRLCATRGQTDIRGLVRHRRTMFVVGSRCLGSGVASPGGGRGAHSFAAGSPRVAGPPPTQPTGLGVRGGGVGSLDLGDRPAEAGELAGGGDGGDCAALRACLQPRPGAMQAPLSAPRDRDRLRRLVLLTIGECTPDFRSGPVVPGGFDQQPPRMPGSGLGDRAEPALLAGRGLAGTSPI